MHLPPLETNRLIIRPFTPDDLVAVHAVLRASFDSTETLDETRAWLTWTIASYQQHARLYQPPYGEYAITLKATDQAPKTPSPTLPRQQGRESELHIDSPSLLAERGPGGEVYTQQEQPSIKSGDLIGTVGLVPSVIPWDVLKSDDKPEDPPISSEFGLYWGIHPDHQRQGYATEAAWALVNYMIINWHVRRIVATTEHDNEASQGVMRKLGMTLMQNRHAEPPWCQVVGVLANTWGCEHNDHHAGVATHEHEDEPLFF